MTKQEPLQDGFLNKLRKCHITVNVYLINGKKLRGKIRSFDQYALLLSGETFQMIYKHAISSIVPLQRLDEFEDKSDETDSAGDQDASSSEED